MLKIKNYIKSFMNLEIDEINCEDVLKQVKEFISEGNFTQIKESKSKFGDISGVEKLYKKKFSQSVVFISISEIEHTENIEASKIVEVIDEENNISLKVECTSGKEEIEVCIDVIKE